jgi:NAD(P)-dependent dehydrogenase (short-subunit alcohol dehydrogenase family)
MKAQSDRQIVIKGVKSQMGDKFCEPLELKAEPTRATTQSLEPAFIYTSDDQHYDNIFQEKGITVTELINNAGISTPDHPHETPGSIVRAHMMDVFSTNVAGVAAVTNGCGVLDRPGGKVVTISSSMASLALTKAANSTSYRCSKAAVNMLIVCFAKQFPDTIFAMVHPGWVQTDMGGAAGRTADISVEESAGGIVQVLEGLSTQQSGSFLDWQGRQLPW